MTEPSAKRFKSSQDDRNVCEKFSASDADLTLESSDGVLFKVHRINFSVHSCIFPGPEVPVNDEVVKFLESSEVLELLLQFIYPNTSPDLEHLPFEILSDLAEASEKYHIFSAMEICRLHMKEHVKQHPLEILAYASKHGYNPLSDDAAPLTLDMELLKVLTALGPAHFARWVLYRESWLSVYRTIGRTSLPDTSTGEEHLGACYGPSINANRTFFPTGGDVFPLHRLNDPLLYPEIVKWSQPICDVCQMAWADKSLEHAAKMRSLKTYSEHFLPF